MTDEQPERWARELALNVTSAATAPEMVSVRDTKAAAILIQRAFTEREAKLVEAAKHLADVADSKMATIKETVEAVVRVRAALKSREAGHG